MMTAIFKPEAAAAINATFDDLMLVLLWCDKEAVASVAVIPPGSILKRLDREDAPAIV